MLDLYAAGGNARLNLEAHLALTNRRQQRLQRAQLTMREALVAGGFDYTPGVGFHQPADPRHTDLQRPPYTGGRCNCCTREQPPRQHGDSIDDDVMWFEDDGTSAAVFTDRHTGAQTVIHENGTVIAGSALDTRQAGIGAAPRTPRLRLPS